jgi:hypothetical protein
MWSWHWSPLTQTSLLLSPSDGLASFLKTILTNGVKVFIKVITSKFRFRLIAIYALGCFRNFNYTPVTKLPWRPPRETRERMNFNDINKKNNYSENCLYIDTCNWCLFFIKKNVTKCLDHHYAIWTSDWPKIKFSGQPRLALISGTVIYICLPWYIHVLTYSD